MAGTSRPRASKPAAARATASGPEASARRLHSAAIHLLRAARREDAALPVGPAQLSALSVLVFGGPRSLGALAKAEHVRAPTMTRIVQGLEAAGLARRRADPRDARSVVLEATRAGATLVRAARRRRERRLAELLADLSADEWAILDRAAELVERAVRGRGAS